MVFGTQRISEALEPKVMLNCRLFLRLSDFLFWLESNSYSWLRWCVDGASWTAATTDLSTSANFYSAAINGTGNAIYISSSSGLYESTNFDTSFMLSYSSSGPLHSIVTSKSGQYAAVSFVYCSLYCTSHSRLSLSNSFSSFYFSSPDTVAMVES